MTYMKLVAQGFFPTTKNKRDQRQVVGRVWALLVTAVVLACALYLLPKRGALTDSAVYAVAADLPPYWSWLEAEGANPEKGRDSGRPVYSYSVIPGGVASSGELELALARDAVAAAHYSGFHAETARPMRLERTRQVYVSYRLGNRIYWTSKKVTLHAGEVLLTDGALLVRGRCGNRISEVPRKPTAPTEPQEPVLNAPVVRRDLFETSELPATPPIWTENPTPFLLAMAPPVSGSPAPGGAPFVPSFPFLPCCGGGVSSHTPTPPPVPPVVPPGPPVSPPTEPPQPSSPPQPVVPTPEPPTVELLVVGVATLLTIVKSRRN